MTQTGSTKMGHLDLSGKPQKVGMKLSLVSDPFRIYVDEVLGSVTSQIVLSIFMDYILKSMTHTVLLEKHAASLSPSLFQHTSKIPPPPVYVFTIFPSFIDHMWTHWSSDPLARYSAFGLNATEYTGCLIFELRAGATRK